MRRRIAMVVLVVLVLTMAAPALATTSERPTTTTTAAVERPAADGSGAQELRRFCAANPEHDRCVVPEVVNVRQMIWRLIKAGEWRQLFQLLQRLGII